MTGSLFDGLDTPKWRDPWDIAQANAAANQPIISNFMRGLEMAQQHEQQKAMLPVKLAEASANIKATNAQTQSILLGNSLKQSAIDDSMADAPVMANWMKENGNKWSKAADAPIPPLRSNKSLDTILNYKAAAAQNSLVQAKKTYSTELLKSAADLTAEGFNIPIDKQTGLPDAGAVAAAGQQLADRKQKFEIQKQEEQTSRLIAGIDARTQGQIEVAQEKGKISLDLLQTKMKDATDKSGTMMNKATSELFKSQLHSVWSDLGLSAEQKAKKMDDVAKQFGVTEKFQFSGEPTLPAKANRTPADGYKVNGIYKGKNGNLRYIGGPINDPSSWETIGGK